MGAIRRKFTKEFKEAAVRRLELGASMAEVARRARSMRTFCTAGGGNCGITGRRRSPAMDSAVPTRAGWPSRNERLAARR